MTSGNLGQLLRRTGRLDEAELRYRQSMRATTEIGDWAAC
ncbi:hypothetical protein KDL28_13935 [Pseudonocardia sp. S2-4]|uniref:Tetratricopeptide repeat protein n=1 Tax=Pseudonocardia humida TaxID=2800819 RepID=A0ABT0ZZI2_9PSEU|nr:hypothetical protein [Pseudonocardia humida]